jgi:hypothetical protein
LEEFQARLDAAYVVQTLGELNALADPTPVEVQHERRRPTFILVTAGVASLAVLIVALSLAHGPRTLGDATSPTSIAIVRGIDS